MATAQTAFFASVAKFAKPFNKNEKQALDPIALARKRFVQAATEAIDAIAEDKPKSFWFKKIGTGYVVQLKNGAKVLDNCSFAVGSKEDATKLLNAAIKSCNESEFDEAFKATARAPRPMKSADPKLNPPAANDAAPAAAKTAGSKK